MPSDSEHPPADTRSGLHRLVVFSDDWGRHPSSCQHLIGQLLWRYPTLWVNTIGTRSPKLSWEDAGKAAKKLWQWVRPPVREAPASVCVAPDGNGESALRNLTVVSPRMFPGFRKGWQRRFNARRMIGAIHHALGPRSPGERRTAITTIPITADLAGTGGLDVDRWVYYCVDDFSVWPGLDGSTLDEMDRDMATKADAIVAVSETLRKRIAGWDRESVLLTHGIDLRHWGKGAAGDGEPGTGDVERAVSPTLLESCGWIEKVQRPFFLFWGVVDQRLDVAWCKALAEVGTLVLLGPQQSPDAALAGDRRILMPGPAPYADLPQLAAAADVLVMPYADLPVTRAIQPLKFKEYLATGKPVIARKLPATIEWSDAADVIETVSELVTTARLRVAEGAPASQIAARQRLAGESWSAKAAVLESVILGRA